ncbi:MAG: ATP-binding cassette domain-containing protein [Thermoleophilia bacterium]|nr:ATP-binding cassette domain-containing protein [Thermoleophilia bacterium]
MEVSLLDIHKHFGTVRANDGITLTVPGGTIQGILGENGAGKSTLMKILSGYLTADNGRITLDGQPVVFRSPADALRHGVGMLHQDPMDFPPMRIADNMLVGAPGGIVPKRRVALAQIAALAQSLGLPFDPRAEVGSLTVGERQQLELLRLLWLGARVLILDEPTTGISALQRQQLFDTLRRLAAEGRTVLFVSHKLDEVQELCTRVAVLRRGKKVGEASPPFAVDELVSMMFEREVAEQTPESCSQDKVVLRLERVGAQQGRLAFAGLDLEVREGEVIGLAGMEGSGQTLLLKACAGLVPTTEGRLWLSGTNVTGKSYRHLRSRGVAYVPASRLEEGLIPGFSLADHFLLIQRKPGFFLHREKGHEAAATRIAEFNIKGKPNDRVESLSGGNQQRALLALVEPDARLLLLEQPTRGLDVESVAYLWEKLRERCRRGAAIIFSSSDLDEILRYSDRVLVFFAGRVSGPLDAASATPEQLGLLIGGGRS